MKKPHKYGAKVVWVDGIRFDSKKEARRYGELKLLEKANIIRGLELQPEFPMIVNGVKVGTYKADFRYFEGEKRIVEDVKGVRTPEYKLKKKIVEAQYNIKIRET